MPPHPFLQVASSLTMLNSTTLCGIEEVGVRCYTR
jgi:hypothetical protein